MKNSTETAVFRPAYYPTLSENRHRLLLKWNTSAELISATNFKREFEEMGWWDSLNGGDPKLKLLRAVAACCVDSSCHGRKALWPEHVGAKSLELLGYLTSETRSEMLICPEVSPEGWIVLQHAASGIRLTLAGDCLRNGEDALTMQEARDLLQAKMHGESGITLLQVLVESNEEVGSQSTAAAEAVVSLLDRAIGSEINIPKELDATLVARVLERQAEIIIRAQKSDHGQAIMIFEHTAEVLKPKGKPSRAAKVLLQAARAWAKAGNQGRAAQLLEQAAKAWAEIGNHEQAATLLEQAARTWAEAGRQEEAAKLMEQAAKAWAEIGNHEQAATLLEQAAKAWAEIGNREQGAKLYVLAAKVLIGNTKYERAALLFEQAAKLSIDADNREQAAMILVLATSAWRKAGRRDLATVTLKNAEDLRKGNRTVGDSIQLKIKDLESAGKIATLKKYEEIEFASEQLYQTKNIIGFTQAEGRLPTVYYLAENGYFGHITQTHWNPYNVGRELPDNHPRYSHGNTGPNGRHQELIDGQIVHTSGSHLEEAKTPEEKQSLAYAHKDFLLIKEMYYNGYIDSILD